MLNNQLPQALQSLFGGAASAPAMGGQAASFGASTAKETKGNSHWGFDGPLRTHFQELDKDGQKEFLKSFNVWNDKAWWDGTTWVDPNQKPDPDGKTDETDGEPTWLNDVDKVRDLGPTGFSDAMKRNLGYGKVTPGMTSSTGLPTSGYTKYVGDPVVSTPKPHPGRPDETYGRPIPRSGNQQQAQAAQGTGMSEMLAKLIGG